MIGSLFDLKLSGLWVTPVFSSGLSIFIANKIEPKPAAMLGSILFLSSSLKIAHDS